MKKIILLLILALTVKIVSAQNDLMQTRLPAGAPQWEIEMFKPGADPLAVSDMYQQYYTTHDFVKNFFTQYYKHWLMRVARDNNGALFNQSVDENKFSEQKYLLNCKQ